MNAWHTLKLHIFETRRLKLLEKYTKSMWSLSKTKRRTNNKVNKTN